ncbi:hypothetical protein Tco_0552268 [Tanacetum coccineum]
MYKLYCSYLSKNINTIQAQQKALDVALVAPAGGLEFRKCNMRLMTDIKPKEATFQVVLDALALTPFYQAFLITAEIENKDAKKTNKMSYPRFTKVIINHFMSNDQSISRRNKLFWHTARDDTMFTSMRCISRHEDTQKADSDTSLKKMPVQANKGTRLKSKAKVAKPDKKKQPAKKTKAKGLAVLSEVALTEAEQLNLATKRSKKDFHMSHVSGSGNGVDIPSKVPDEQPQKTSGTDEGTGTIPGVLDLPTYESKSEKESWGDSEDEDDNDDDGDNDDGDNDDDGDSDDHEDGKEEYVDEFYEGEEEENIDDEETMYDDEDDEVTKELYEDVNVNLGNVDTEMTNVDQGASDQQNVSQQSGFKQVEEDAHVTITPVHDTQKADEPVQSSFVSSDFTSKLLNLENPYRADNEIALLMETLDRHATPIPENTSKTTTSLPALLDFAFEFKFNERVFNLEKDVSEIKQVDQYAQALSSIPAIVDHYMDNKLREAINKAIQAHNFDCKEEAQAKKREYIELVDLTVRTIIKEEVNAQLPQILPQAVSDVATLVIEKNVTESVEAAVLTRSSSQLMSTYEADASLFEFELTKILIDKMEKNKSYDKSDYKKKLYDALVESNNTNKDLFDSYGEVFSLKRSRDEKDKDQDPPLDQTEGQKEENRVKMLSPPKIQGQRKRSLQVHLKKPPNLNISLLENLPMRKSQIKKPERPPTPDPDWSMRQQVDFQPPQTWISQVARAKEPPTSFDFSAFVINWLKILNLTQEILVIPAFNLLKGTCKSITELEYHLEEYLRKPLPLIQDHRGCQIIPQDYFINKDLEYLKGGDFIRRYSTSVTKTKAASYHLKWIEDLVPNLWSPVQVKYDQHAYLGTSHWGPKCQRFYDYASNLTSSKDVYSRRRIIAVTRLKVMKKYDYGHLEEIEVRRDD